MTIPKDSSKTFYRPSDNDQKQAECGSIINILLIGNDDVELLQVWDMLDKADNSYYDIKIVNSSEDALKYAENTCLDLCFIDLNLDGNSAHELIENLRGLHKGSAFILLLDEESPDTISFALEAGFDDCLVKRKVTIFDLEKSIKFAVGRHLQKCDPVKNSPNQSESKYKAVFENANDAIFIIQDNKIIDCNSKACEIFRCTRDQIINQSPFIFNSNPQPDGLFSVEKIQKDVKAAQEGIPQIFEWKHRRYDNTEFFSSVSLTKIELDHKLCLIAIVRDITTIRQTEQLIVDREEKFRSIYNNVQVGLFKTRSSDGLILECNDRFAKILGYNYVEELANKVCVGESVYADSDVRERMLSELNTYGEVRNFEMRCNCADGQQKWLRYSARLNSEKGYLEGVATDITLEKKAFDMLRKSNRKVRNILESIRDGFYTLDDKLVITYFNRAAERILGCNGNEILGMNLFLALPEFRGEYLEREFRKALRTKTSSSLELNLTAEQDGDWYEIRIYPGEDGLSVYFSEITARKRFEQMLLDSERKMQSIFATAAEGILIIDRDGHIESFNPAAKHIFKYDQDKLQNEQITVLIPDFLTEIAGLLDKANNNFERKISNFELTGKRYDGSRFPLKLSVSEMILNGQQWYTVIIHDLTDEREQMSRLMEMDKFSAIGTLAAGVAHEFKNYLAGIIGNASFGLEYLDNKDGLKMAREAFEQVINIGENANRVTLSLLTYSHNNLYEKTREDLNALIEEVLTIISKKARAANVEIETDLKVLPKQNVFAGKFQQMILNLILNAKQAIENKGIIRISTSLQDEYITIEVEDNGCGIPDENQGRIFDPFFSTRGVWGEHKDNGAGLGLSICRNITTEHGGDISVKSKVNEGSVFTIKLPVNCYKAGQTDTTPDFFTQNIFLFSAEESTIHFFSELTHKAETELHVCNEINDLDNIHSEQILVVLDAGYPGMGELYRIGSYCKEKDICFIIVNSGKHSEYQLEELFNDAKTVLQGLPEINLISQEIIS